MKVMLRHRTLALWLDMKRIKFRYSQILMKTLEMNGKSQNNRRGVLTKLLISHLLMALEYQTLYHNNARAKYYYFMVDYERNLI